MKIGLLSYHKNYNYGWNLQCYALLSVLKSLGHDVVYIDKRLFSRKKPLMGHVKSLVKQVLCKLGLMKANLSYEYIQECKGKNINPFFLRYITPRTKAVFSRKQLKELPHFDAIVVGSDQVWRSKLVYPIENYYLDFIDYHCKRISYAASFGTDAMEYSLKEISKCKKLVEKFDAISVREVGGINLMVNKYKWNVNPCVMPDPTLLLDKDDYCKLIKDGNVASMQGDMFCYILDDTEDKQSVIEKLSSRLCYQPFMIKAVSNDLVPNPSIEQWLSSFMNAKFVFTDSFHGCVFSLIFRKPFVVYGNQKRGMSRFESLLEHFEQKERLIMHSMDLNEGKIERLAYMAEKFISDKQNNLRTVAFDFLEKNLTSYC